MPCIGQSRQDFREAPNARSPRNLRISGAYFMGVSLRKHSSLGCSGVTRCDLLPRKEAGCQHAKARRVSSSRSLAALAFWAEPCSRRAATPLICLLFRKTAGRSKERQIAKPRFPAISDPLKERLLLFALRGASHLGPFSAPRTGNSDARVTIPPQSLRLYIVLVHSC